MKNKTKRSVLTLGAIVALSLAATPAVMANPFQASSLRNGDLLADNTATTKPADGKCGGKMMKDSKCGAKSDSMPGKMMMKDGVMMKNGKMMMMKDGNTMMMDKEMMMSNGTKVMPDGTVMMTGGKKMMMKDGEMMNMNGEMMSGKMMKDGKCGQGTCGSKKK